MSFWSMLANIFHIRKRQKTLPIILRAWEDGGVVCALLMLPQQVAENIQPLVQMQQPDGTWKSYELQSFTGISTMGRWQFCPLSFYPSDHPAEDVGSIVKTLRDSFGPPDDPSISVDSSCSVSIQVPVQATS